MNCEYESPNFTWCYDSYYGVGRFIRKSDGAMTALETGTDCQRVRAGLRRLKQKTASAKYPLAAPSFAQVFDSIALEYDFRGTE